MNAHINTRVTYLAIALAVAALFAPALSRAETMTFPDGSKVIYNDRWYGPAESWYGSTIGSEGLYEVFEGNSTIGQANGTAQDDVAQAYLAAHPCTVPDLRTYSMDPNSDNYYGNAPGYDCEDGRAFLTTIGMQWFNSNFTTASQYMQWESSRTDTDIDHSRVPTDDQSRVTAIYGTQPNQVDGYWSPDIPGITACYPGGSCPADQAASCSVTFDKNPVATGGSTTMHWSSTGATLFYINNVGYVGTSGSAQVSPSETTDYSGDVSGPNGTASCAASLATGGDDGPGGPGGGGPGGGGQCNAPLTCSSDGNLHDTCSDTTVCQFGCSTQTNTCNLSCTPQHICNSTFTAVVNSCTGGIIENCANENKICSAGQCVSTDITFIDFTAYDSNNHSFDANGHLQASPSLVTQGGTTHLYWDVGNAQSCSVTGTNGDSWNTLFSGASGQVSGPIAAQTVFTLTCQSLAGALTPTAQESATVNVVPVFNER